MANIAPQTFTGAYEVKISHEYKTVAFPEPYREVINAHWNVLNYLCIFKISESEFVILPEDVIRDLTKQRPVKYSVNYTVPGVFFNYDHQYIPAERFGHIKVERTASKVLGLYLEDFLKEGSDFKTCIFTGARDRLYVCLQ